MTPEEKSQLAAAVAELGALPMPAGTDPKTKDDLRLVLENAVTYAAELERQRNAFREQRNSVFATNERLLGEVTESDQARLLAENETRTVRREADALRARVAELEAERHSTNEALDDAVQALRADKPTVPATCADHAPAMECSDGKCACPCGKPCTCGGCCGCCTSFCSHTAYCESAWLHSGRDV